MQNAICIIVCEDGWKADSGCNNLIAVLEQKVAVGHSDEHIY